MVKVQPVVMPVTPLARGMWRFGGCAPVGSDDLAKTKSIHPAHIDALGKNVRKTVTVPQVICTRKDSTSSDDACDVRGRADTRRYQSVDATGRTWGMPSAFGGGQCLDCPKKAVPPSMRCESCQQIVSQGQPISMDELQQLQGSVNPFLQGFSGKKHVDIARRLDQLYLLLQAGKIAEPIKAKLLLFARALSLNDCTEATRQVAAMSAEHWDQHKQWLIGLRRLLSGQ